MLVTSRGMSKAFTRESDDASDLSAPPRQPSPLPAGAKNYVTAEGARRLREELDRLVQVTRPRIAALAGDADARRQCQVLDQRIVHLQQSLLSAEVVAPPAVSDGRIRFGATVTVRDRRGGEATYRIVGVDETDIDRGWVSWVSPIAKALLTAQLGERIRFRFPSGEDELEICGVAYE